MGREAESHRARLFLTRLDYQPGKGTALGSWCLSAEKLFDDAAVAETLPYTVGGRDEVRFANVDVARAYSRLLPALADTLNRAHNLDRGTAFWKPVIGYWFRQFLDVVYERSGVIQNAQMSAAGARVAIIPLADEWVAADTDAYSVGLFSDRLNHQLFGQILRHSGGFDLADDQTLVGGSDELLGRRRSSALLKKVASIVSCVLTWRSKVIFLRTYFSKSLLTRLSIRFRSIPLAAAPSLEGSSWQPDRARRINLQFKLPTDVTPFEELAMQLVPANIPMIFLEKFPDLLDLADRFRPKHAKVFMTANAFAAQEVYKVWAGDAMENPAQRHVILQHGANYGHSAVMSEEEFEIDSAGQYLTTGWVKPGSATVEPFVASPGLSGIGDFRTNPASQNAQGNLLWVLASLPRYQYTQWSAAQGPNFRFYLQEQAAFLNALDDSVRAMVLCRGYHFDYGWSDMSFIERLAGAFPIDLERRPLRLGIKKARLVMFTYESTSMMESMAMNVPTICFWDPESWGWRDDAQPLLQRLAAAEIYHESAVAAAAFINLRKDENGLEDWWSSTAVQAARNAYCEAYTNTSNEEYTLWSEKVQSWLDEGLAP